jgi:hypothetical protein
MMLKILRFFKLRKTDWVIYIRIRNDFYVSVIMSKYGAICCLLKSEFKSRMVLPKRSNCEGGLAKRISTQSSSSPL